MRKGMVWMVEKKIVHHVLDMGFERVEIPVRVKKETLYNHKAIEKRFPMVKLPLLDREIEKTVEDKIMRYLGQCGLLRDTLQDTTGSFTESFLTLAHFFTCPAVSCFLLHYSHISGLGVAVILSGYSIVRRQA